MGAWPGPCPCGLLRVHSRGVRSAWAAACRPSHPRSYVPGPSGVRPRGRAGEKSRSGVNSPGFALSFRIPVSRSLRSSVSAAPPPNTSGTPPTRCRLHPLTWSGWSSCRAATASMASRPRSALSVARVLNSGVDRRLSPAMGCRCPGRGEVCRTTVPPAATWCRASGSSVGGRPLTGSTLRPEEARAAGRPWGHPVLGDLLGARALWRLRDRLVRSHDEDGEGGLTAGRPRVDRGTSAPSRAGDPVADPCRRCAGRHGSRRVADGRLPESPGSPPSRPAQPRREVR